ncbi:MAG: helix-turn-helix domain-containing protein [Flavobacteriales bacterium]
MDRLIKQGKTQKQIAEALGCHKSTVSREISRNTPRRGKGAKQYDPEKAQIKTDRRHRDKNKRITFTDEMKRTVVNQLTVTKLSPEFISVVGRKENPSFISHETI